MVFDFRLVRVMRIIRGILYEARDKVYCESYMNESPHESSVSTYM
jgi:hypothetical protein